MAENPENRDFSIEKSVDKAGVRRAYVDIFNWKKVMKSSDSSESADTWYIWLEFSGTESNV